MGRAIRGEVWGREGLNHWQPLLRKREQREKKRIERWREEEDREQREMKRIEMEGEKQSQE